MPLRYKLLALTWVVLVFMAIGFLAAIVVQDFLTTQTPNVAEQQFYFKPERMVSACGDFGAQLDLVGTVKLQEEFLVVGRKAHPDRQVIFKVYHEDKTNEDNYFIYENGQIAYSEQLVNTAAMQEYPGGFKQFEIDIKSIMFQFEDHAKLMEDYYHNTLASKPCD